MAKKPTIYDVSRLAKVSAATVSRVLNNPGIVNSATREAVENAIRSLDYKPLLEARLRSSRETRRVCVLAPHFTATSFVMRLRGIALSLNSSEVELQVYSVNSLSQMENFFETIEMRDLDGLICLSLIVQKEQIERALNCDVQVVLVEQASDLTDCIVINDRRGGYLAGKYLLDKGRRKIGWAGESMEWDYSAHTNTSRFGGLTDALDEAGLRLPEEWRYAVELDVNAARAKFTEIFKQGNYPEALFCAADTIAFGVMRAARDCGLNVPGDVAIVGFDDIDFADYLGLTTVSQHLDESGKIAAELLMMKLLDPERAIQKIELGLSLIERDSA